MMGNELGLKDSPMEYRVKSKRRIIGRTCHTSLLVDMIPV